MRFVAVQWTKGISGRECGPFHISVSGVPMGSRAAGGMPKDTRIISHMPAKGHDGTPIHPMKIKEARGQPPIPVRPLEVWHRRQTFCMATASTDRSASGRPLRAVAMKHDQRSRDAAVGLAGATTSAFLANTYEMLEDSRNAGIVTWNPTGTGLIVIKVCLDDRVSVGLRGGARRWRAGVHAKNGCL